jgi:hypothetical protein
MFPWQVFGLTGSDLLARLPKRISAQCRVWRSYLLTAAGQFRSRTGFPFHPPLREEPSEWAKHILVPQNDTTL